jgi:hypothetical protein
VTTPPAFAGVFWLQVRAAGIDPPRTAPLPGWLRALFLVQAVIFGLFGLALLVAPSAAAPLWPWALTPLTAQAIAAWLIAIGVAGIGVLVENDRPSSAGPAQSYAFLGALQLLAVLRFSADLDWSHPLAWPYVAFWFVVMLSGAWGAIIAGR